MVKLKIDCPQCKNGELDEAIGYAYCRECKISIRLTISYDYYRDHIEKIKKRHGKKCSKKMQLTTKFNHFIILHCKCQYRKIVGRK